MDTKNQDKKKQGVSATIRWEIYLGRPLLTRKMHINSMKSTNVIDRHVGMPNPMHGNMKAYMHTWKAGNNVTAPCQTSSMIALFLIMLCFSLRYG